MRLATFKRSSTDDDYKFFKVVKKNGMTIHYSKEFRATDHDGYYVSEDAHVMSCKRKKPIILKPYKHYKGYLKVTLFVNGKIKGEFVHRLVGKSWIPNPLNKPQINHLRGKMDNSVQYLEWVTNQENSDHRWGKGKYKNKGVA